MIVPSDFQWVFLLLLAAAGLAWRLGKLTFGGALAAAGVGAAVYLGSRLPGLALLFAFFVLGSGATGWKMRRKRALGLGEANRGRRSAVNVLANGGVAAGLSLTAWLIGGRPEVWPVMAAASLAAATADTVSSELGNVYGRRFVNILTLRPDARGRDGVISPEGTLLGAAGSILIALLYGWLEGFSATAGWIALAGVFGNAVDSVLGAGLQRRGYLNNHSVNFFNTLAAALLAGLLFVAG